MVRALHVASYLQFTPLHCLDHGGVPTSPTLSISLRLTTNSGRSSAKQKQAAYHPTNHTTVPLNYCLVPHFHITTFICCQAPSTKPWKNMSKRPFNKDICGHPHNQPPLAASLWKRKVEGFVLVLIGVKPVSYQIMVK